MLTTGCLTLSIVSLGARLIDGRLGRLDRNCVVYGLKRQQRIALVHMLVVSATA
jgi:hypothetical protein